MNLYQRIFHGLLHWQIDTTEPLPDKCIICVAPHTSNWDFIMGELYIRSIGSTANFLMKREWFFWPLGVLLRRIGGVPVVRSRHTSLTDQLAARAAEASEFRLAVTPEGTRSRVTTWKRGFYFIALKAKLPILLYGLDYGERKVVCHRTLIPSGDVEADMRQIMDYYAQFHARYPEKFALEEIPATE